MTWSGEHEGPRFSRNVPERTGAALRCLYGVVPRVPVEAWAESFHVSEHDMAAILTAEGGVVEYVPNAPTYVRPDLAEAIQRARAAGEPVPSIALRLRCTQEQVYSVMEGRAVVAGLGASRAAPPPARVQQINRARLAYGLGGFSAKVLARLQRVPVDEMERAIFGMPPYEAGLPVRPLTLPTPESAQGLRNLHSIVGEEVERYAECFVMTVPSMKAFLAGYLGRPDATVLVAPSGRREQRRF